MNKWIPALALALVLTACEEKPYGALPSPQQIAWQDMEMTMFCNFGPNTFTGLEWGEGTEAEDLFNPTDLACRQWARTAKAAGFKGIIITAKHHDGFCLWPSPVSVHTVAQSSWRDGQGDVLRELSDACKEYDVDGADSHEPDEESGSYGNPHVVATDLCHARHFEDGSGNECHNGRADTAKDAFHIDVVAELAEAECDEQDNEERG